MLLDKIKSEQLLARKNKDEIKKSLLTTLIGEAVMVGKNARNGDPTDDEVIQTLKKFEKNLNETINLMRSKGNPSASMNQWFEELSIIQSFLPSKLEDQQIANDIARLMIVYNLPNEQKSMGLIMKLLKEEYGQQFDGAQVSSIFKRILA